MDNNERNEHFKDFAELLWDDLYQVAGAVMIDTITESDLRENAEITAQLKTIIAQRAYDLAAHVLAHQLATDHYIRWPALSAQEALQDGSIPDLTAWPKTTLEASAPDE